MTSKPKIVQKALYILWVALLLNIGRLVYANFYLNLGGYFKENILLILVSLALNILFIFCISKRKNWARWIYLIFYGVGNLFLIYSTVDNIAQDYVGSILNLIEIAAQFVGSLLLFSAQARAWFQNVEVSQIRSLKTSKNVMLISVLVFFLCTIPFLGPLYLLAGIMGYQAIYSGLFDGKSNFYPKEIGKEVHLAPFAVVVKMKEYGGWRDEYNYIFANNTSISNVPRLNQYTVFKVIDEKTRSSILNSTDKICILESLKDKTLKASVQCNEIPHINEATKVITHLSNTIKAKGKAYVATTADRRDSNIKRVLKINRFIIFEVHSEDELKEIVAPDNDQNESYDYLMRLTDIISIDEADVFDEIAQSKIFIHHYGGQWDEKIFGYTTLESYIQNNKTAPDMENFLMHNHPDPKDRWAIRSILSVVQQALALEKKWMTTELQSL